MALQNISARDQLRARAAAQFTPKEDAKTALRSRAQAQFGASSATAPTAPAQDASYIDEAKNAGATAGAALRTIFTQKNEQTKAANTAAADALRASTPQTTKPVSNTGNRLLDAATNASNAYNTFLDDKPATERGRVSNALNAAGNQNLATFLENIGFLTSGDTSDYDATFGADADRLGNNKLAKTVSSTLEQGRKALNEKAYSAADELSQKAQENVTMAKDGLGTVGSFLVDAGVAGTQLLGDIGFTAATGGSALIPMGVRAFGMGAQQARQAGASTDEQFLYGLGSAAVEVLTEKIANVSTPFKAYGKGTLDGIVEGVIGKLAKSGTGKAVLKTLASAVSEGGEEAISDLVNPMLQTITYNPDALKQYGDKEYWSTMLSDAVVGGTLGLVASGVDVVNGVRADKANAQTSGKDINAPTTRDTIAPNLPKAEQTSPVTVQSDINTPQENPIAPNLTLQPQNTAQNENVEQADTIDENSIKTGSGIISGLKIKYVPDLKAEARNWHTYIEVGDKFFNLDAEGQAEVLAHEVQHTLAQNLYNGDSTLFEAVMNNPAFGVRKEAPNGKIYWEGIFGDVGSNSVDETFTQSLTVYDRNPMWMKENHPDAYEFIKGYKEAQNPVQAPTIAQDATQTKPVTYTGNGTESNVAQPDATHGKLNNIPQQEQNVNGNVQTDLPQGVGAASQGFAGTVERGFSHNVATDNAMNEDIREDYQLDPEMYNRLGNKDTLNKAQTIYDTGISNARAAVEQAIGAAQSGAKLAPEMVPLGRMVANTLAKQGDLDGARQILSSIAIELTQAGQLGQAANILRQSDAATVLQTVEKQVDKINEAGRKKYGKNWKDFKLTDDELKAVQEINAGDTVAIQAVIQMIGKRIGAEMPSTAWDKITEFRRVAMLLNPKTQIRNILGNVPLVGMRKLSETMSAAVQDMAVNMGLLDKADRTRTLGVSKESKAIANDLFTQYKGVLTKTDKWDITSIINENQAVFHNVPLEKVREFTYGLLEKGDLPFLKSAFVDNAAGYIEAQGYKSASDVPQKVIDTASREALAATFRDASALAQWLNGTKRNSGAAGAALDVLLPFTTTPINIARRTADYSPLGALKLLNVSNRAEAAKVIDTLTKSVTGSGIMFLGFMLSKLGWITSGQDEDRDKAQFEAAIGKQPYSIMGKYSYDWAQPVGTQLAIGAEMYKAIQGDTTLVNAIMNSIYAGGDAMLNLTFFSNIQELFDSNGSTTQNAAETIATGFASQLIPTLLGQTARTADTTMRSTYTGGSLLDNILAQAKAKIPGLSETLPESVDIRGETKTRLTNPLARVLEQFASPGTINANSQNAVDEEIQRVYDSTGDAAVFPRYALGYFTASGTKYTMNGEERSQFQRTLGTETYSGLNKLFNSADYKKATDAEKSDMISGVISEANDKAKQELVESRGEMYLDSDGRDKVQTYTTAGISQKQAYSLYKALDALEPLAGESDVSTYQKAQTISKQSYTQAQKTALIATLYTDSSKESLLPALNISGNLISRYLTTQDSEFVNMTVPDSFTSDKVEYELTDKERQTFRSTYAQYFNSRATNVTSDDALKRLRDKAYEAAKAAVLRDRK